MNKLSGLGGLTAIAGIVLLIFKVIGSLTEKPLPLADMTLADFMGAATLEQVDNLTNGFMRVCAEGIVDTPLYLHLIITGIVLLIISGLISK